MLDVHRLRVFRSVVASGSIQAAAVNLGYTPSAVSQHVSALQRETGLVLMTRVGRGITPTVAGRTLAAQVDGVLARLGEVDAVVSDLRTGRSGSFTIAYFASVGAAWMPTVVAGLQAAFPEVRLDLTLREDVPDDALERSDLQIAVEQPGSHDRPGLRAHHLLDDPYVVLLPDDHLLAGRDRIELGELTGDRWIDNDFARGWCRRNLIEACRAAGFSPPFHLEAHDYPTAAAFVASRVGITVLPRLGARTVPDGVRAVPVVSPTPVRSIYALVSDTAADLPVTALALESLRACAATSDAKAASAAPVR